MHSAIYEYFCRLAFLFGTKLLIHIGCDLMFFFILCYMRVTCSVVRIM